MRKLQHLTTYKTYHSFLKENFKIISISDLHFSSKVTTNKLNAIYQNLEQQQPDYILIVGDLIDSLEVMKIKKEKQRLMTFLSTLATLAPVLISKGNHDFYSFNRKKEKASSLQIKSQEYFAELNRLSNIHVLDNTFYEDNKIYVAGFTQTPDYYKTPRKKKSISFGTPENKERLMEILKKNYQLRKNLPKDKICIAMIHSPIYLKEIEVEKQLEEFDYILAGHMHHGCVPPFINEIWPSSRGFIAPNKMPFPENARNTMNKRGDKLIVNGALVTFQKCAKWMQLFNFLFPVEATALECTNDPTYNTERVYQKSKYFRPSK